MEVVVREPLALAANERSHLLEALVELGFIVAFESLHCSVIEFVELGDQVVELSRLLTLLELLLRIARADLGLESFEIALYLCPGA